MNKFFGSSLVVICLGLLTYTVVFSEQSPATKRLLERYKMFEPKIIKVAENVYTAIGYQVSANSMIIGDDGVIIIDPRQLVPASQKVRKAFEEITDKPVKAIIYTHAHGNHTNGAAAFYDEGGGIQIWARANFGSEQARNAERGITGGIRNANSQGFDLLPEQKIGIGVAIPPDRVPARYPGRGGLPGQRGGGVGPPSARIEPTHKFSESRIQLEIAGVNFEIVAAPGETNDQLYVWLPEQRIVFAGDNFYQSWPNIYPLRGTARRSTRRLDKKYSQDVRRGLFAPCRWSHSAYVGQC